MLFVSLQKAKTLQDKIFRTWSFTSISY